MSFHSVSKKWSIAVLVCWTLFMAEPWEVARAEDVVIGFTAIVTDVDDYECRCVPDSAISVGDTLLGYYHYDSDTPDAVPSPNVGWYVHTSAPYGFAMYVGDYVFSSDKNNPDLKVALLDSLEPGGGNPADDDDEYSVSSVNNLGDPFQPGQNLYELDLWLHDNSGLALANDTLPATPPVLGEWPTSRWTRVWGAGLDYYILARIVAFHTGPPTGIKPHSRPRFSITNYPNPFNPTTTIRYHTSVAGDVSLRVYDVRGRIIRTLVDKRAGPGDHTVVWGGADRHGNTVGSGLYFVRLKAGKTVLTRKIVLLK